MDYKRREEIFSKDHITTQELQELLGFKTLGEASSMMTKIRLKVGDRLGIRGRIHTEDYFEYFGIKPTDRYDKPTEDTDLTLPQDCKAPLSIQERHNQIFKERGIV